MSTLNQELYDSKVNRAAMMRLHENKLTGEIKVEIDNHSYRLEEFVKRSDLKSRVTREFLEELELKITKTYSNLKQLQQARLLKLFGDQSGYLLSAMGIKLGKLYEIHAPTRAIAENVVLHQPLYKNTTLQAGWQGISINERKRVEQVLRKGIADGMSIAELAREVRNSVNISIPAAVGLARTSITSVAAQADMAVYEANEALLRGYQYVAVLDSRTTPLCALRDGKIYPISDKSHLPPAHWNCRSTTVPVVRSLESLNGDIALLHLRKNNMGALTEAQKKFYDGEAYGVGSYSDWLKKQPVAIQKMHLGSTAAVDMFASGRLSIDKFSDSGRMLTVAELRMLTDAGYGVPGDTLKFAAAKERIDALDLGIATPDELIRSEEFKRNLKEYYLLQAKELEGQLSLTNYRGVNLGNKKLTKQRVLTRPPTEEQLRFNPLLGRYEDARRYSPQPAVLENRLRLVDNAPELKPSDKKFIRDFIDGFREELSINEQAVVVDNLRVLFTRYRKNGEAWGNFKAVAQSQIKFDIMNVSDMLETHTRAGADVLKKLTQKQFFDPVLGTTDLQFLHDNLVNVIKRANRWEDKDVHAIARKMTWHTRSAIPIKVFARLSSEDIALFNSKTMLRLANADSPDRDQLAIQMGRDLFTLANYRGSKREWFEVGEKIIDSLEKDGILVTKTFGVQKRRMKSKIGGHYFGPYYDTEMRYIEILEPRLLKYAKLRRQIDVGMRVGSVDSDRNRFVIRPGFKTYFIKEKIGYYDTRIPITSTSSFSDFPADVIDEDMATALNWAGKSEYRVDPDFYNFMKALLYYKDEHGRVKYFDDLNTYREFMLERGDVYERLKMMDFLVEKNRKFSNVAFLDHRGRVYERGFISPQAGEAFRPFLNTAKEEAFSRAAFLNLQDQIGAFLGGASDELEGRFNSLSVLGRQEIAKRWKGELISLGNHMLKAKPKNIQAVLESSLFQAVDGEEQAKLLRFAIEMAKIDNFLKGDYSNLHKLNAYKTALALEQDASSSGAQIIAMTTRNRQLAALSNVITTNQKARLYDVIARDTFEDPRFKELNEKLGLTEKDLRKAAKAQNMVTLYGAGERTGIMNVENKLAKALGKEADTLVVRAADRDKILDEISARAARYEKYDPEMQAHLLGLRKEVKDAFNKGQPLGDEMMEELYFLEPKTRDVIEKLSRQYSKVVTPDDFKKIASIMSEHLSERVPILRDFTKYFGRLAESYLLNASPKAAKISYTAMAKQALLHARKNKKPLPPAIARILGIRNETLRESLLKRFGWWDPESAMDNFIFGAARSGTRREGFVFGKVAILDWKISKGIEVGFPNKLPKSWTHIPWVNFDGKTLEQHFTQSFEEKLLYKKDGKWYINIVQVQQRTEPTWWEEFRNKEGKFNDIADVQKARTAFAVNGNHSNDATLVKQFHLWGARNGVQTSTIHDAFFTNAAHMLDARDALRVIYARAVDTDSIKQTLLEMRRRGMPQELYEAYYNEAVEKGLIPVPGKSIVGGKVLEESDILTSEEVLQPIRHEFDENRYFYGVG